MESKIKYAVSDGKNVYSAQQYPPGDKMRVPTAESSIGLEVRLRHRRWNNKIRLRRSTGKVAWAPQAGLKIRRRRWENEIAGSTGLNVYSAQRYPPGDKIRRQDMRGDGKEVVEFLNEVRSSSW